jgi:hypothetical protein
VLAGLVAAAGWGLALPESPLMPYLDDPVQTFAPLIAGFGALALLFLIGKELQKPAS